MNRKIRTLIGRVAACGLATVLALGTAASTALGAVTVPDMFGPYPNYATSPLPVVTSTPVPVEIGNTLTDRAYATDYPPLSGTDGLAPVLVVVPTAVLQTGTLLSFSTWNQATTGSSPTPSAGDGVQTNGSFYAYVLRPTGVANEYSVVYQSGLNTVPAPAIAGTSELATYPVPAGVTVQAGDVIAFYGEGIPVDTGVGTDALVYSTSSPVPAPAAGSTITLGAGSYPIYPQARTYSIAATVDTGVTTTTISGGMRKFVDGLPQLDTPNNLGQSLPVAVPDTVTYPGSDYYEIEYREYEQQMHSDLPPTRLRGYVQVNSGTDTSVCGTACTAADNTVVPAAIQYLGPVILAHEGRPVRVKFVNRLPFGPADATGHRPGDLFIPTDTTYMGTGTGPNGGTEEFTQNRSTTHLHGGATPWISDGTPHQWTTPKGETTSYPDGVSRANVPDMWFDAAGNAITSCAGQLTCAVDGATNDPGSDAQTLYYTNQQSARLMFYHDHALGITRLNVYAGMAAGYLETDPTEQTLISGGPVTYTQPDGIIKTVDVAPGTLPGLGIPLIIQDKTYVPPTSGTFTNQVGTFASQLEAQDPTWDTTLWGGVGQLWFPHVYMPNQNAYDITGANAMGRWDYGPWFWPPFTGILYGEVANPYYDPANAPWEPPMMPGTPDARATSPSGTPESFMDTPVINGTAYPYMEVDPGLVRFRILNASNDRFINLSLFVAADKNSPTTAGSTGTVMCDGSDPNQINPADCTEVKMVPFNSTQNAVAPFPSWWYTVVQNGFTFDDRDGGVPDPATRGPAMIQVGTEGGFLPEPAVIHNQPVNYVYNRRDITVGNVNEKALFIGPAERADVVVDFSKFAGKTLILYNDSPAPVPAADPRLDYFTGDRDLTLSGGAPSTLPGYGPNTRTMMQIRVRGTATPGNTDPDYVDPTVMANLQAALPAAFAASQEPIIVPQQAYDGVYGTTTTDTPGVNFSTIQGTEMTFEPINQPALTLPMEPKSIIEDFTVDYGRMNAILGLEIPHTNNTNQTSILQAYIDPPTELVRLTAATNTPAIGEAADGTQLWKITHNGVDTHAIHFHMFHVQLVNRVGWDGAIRKPDANELGWKDTVRMNPLEDVIVALRPKTLDLPFPVVNSWRPLDPTQPLGATLGFTNVDPNGNPVTVTNEMTNFGWEHVWHCHLLGHEENDMMRPLAVVAPPDTPTNLAAVRNGGDALLTWTDTSVNETSFTVQKDTDPTFPAPASVALGANVTAYTDPGAALGAFYYRVLASNTVGAVVPNSTYPQMTADSTWSNTAQIAQVPAAGITPTALDFGGQTVGTTSAPQSVTLSNTGVVALTFTTATTGDFAESDTCGGSVPAGGSCALDVTFTPTVEGALTGDLTVTTNDPANPTLTVALSGTGVAAAPIAGMTPTSLTFADQVVNTVSAAQDVVLSNTGTAPLSITSGPTVTGEFGVVNNCPPTLAQGLSCTLSVTFAPTVAGVQTGNLTIGTNDPLSPTLTVTLSGNGLAQLLPPAAPSNLAGTATRLPRGTPGRLTTDSVSLTWTDNANNETGFTVQRAQVFSNRASSCASPTTVYATVGTTGANVATYSELAPRGGNLCYRVQATNAAGGSAWSNLAFVTTP